MLYRIYLGSTNCSKCGKKCTKIVEIDGVQFGTDCAKEILGKDYTAPIWLYKVADNYVQSKDYLEDNYDDFVINFFDDSYGHKFECDDRSGSSKVWKSTIRIDGKSVKVEWQEEIADYLKNRHQELRND